MLQVETHSGTGSLAPTSGSQSSFMQSYLPRDTSLTGRSVFIKRGPCQGRIALVVAELSKMRLGVYLEGDRKLRRVLQRGDVLALFNR